MTTYLDTSLSSDRFRAALVAAFGLTGLVLVLVGVGGITARSVAERTRELGVRLALGAVPARLWVRTTCDAMKSVTVGIGVGAIAAVVAMRLVSTFLVGLQRPSAAVWAIEVAVVCGLCALAAGLPAHRVTEIAPMIALRAD